MNKLNPVICHIHRTLGTLPSQVDIENSLKDETFFFTLPKYVLKSINLPSTLLTQRVIVPRSLSILKKLALYERVLKKYLVDQISSPEKNMAFQKRLENYFKQLNNTGEIDPTFFLKAMGWLSYNLKVYCQDVRTEQLHLKQLKENIATIMAQVKAEVIPKLEQQKTTELEKLSEEEERYNARIKEEDREASQLARLNEREIEKKEEGLLSSIGSCLSNVVSSIGQAIGSGFTTLNRAATQATFTTRYYHYSTLPNRGEEIVDEFGKSCSSHINKHVQAAQLKAVSQAVDKVAEQSIKLSSQQVGQFFTYFLLYKGYRLYGYLTNPVEEILTSEGWEEWLYPLAFSALTTIAVSQVSLRTWVYSRENEPSTPPKNEFPSEFQHFLKDLNSTLAKSVMERVPFHQRAADFFNDLALQLNSEVQDG